MLIQNFVVISKEYYGMLWYFLEWSIVVYGYIIIIHEVVTYVST